MPRLCSHSRTVKPLLRFHSATTRTSGADTHDKPACNAGGLLWQQTCKTGPGCEILDSQNEQKAAKQANDLLTNQAFSTHSIHPGKGSASSKGGKGFIRTKGLHNTIRVRAEECIRPLIYQREGEAFVVTDHKWKCSGTHHSFLSIANHSTR